MPASDKANVILVSVAIAIGVAIGFYSGYLGRETKRPGEAIRTSDATGHWKRHAEPAADINAEILTNTRIRLIMQAIPTFALLNAGALPESLDALISDGLLGKDVIRDGWDRPLIYTADHEQGTYAVRSLGPDGVASDDDIPTL
ncbi:MAG: type II secretion system protein GspG [Kiritimatiellae bacterium]|nr:type II secretion system protein GspG [Kiritimatiellia bacterium]